MKVHFLQKHRKLTHGQKVPINIISKFYEQIFEYIFEKRLSKFLRVFSLTNQNQHVSKINSLQDLKKEHERSRKEKMDIKHQNSDKLLLHIIMRNLSNTPSSNPKYLFYGARYVPL